MTIGEKIFEDARCGDCYVKPGEPHDDGCDVARCLVTGLQRLQCSGIHFHEAVAPGCYTPRDCGRDIWTGRWPGDDDAIALGWYSVFRPGDGGWVRCDKDTPDAVPDLNRLATEARWDRESASWKLP